MSWGFEIGRVYNRLNDIHARFGGQQQGGIITPKDHPPLCPKPNPAEAFCRWVRQTLGYPSAPPMVQVFRAANPEPI